MVSLTIHTQAAEDATINTRTEYRGVEFTMQRFYDIRQGTPVAGIGDGAKLLALPDGDEDLTVLDGATLLYLDTVQLPAPARASTMKRLASLALQRLPAPAAS
jgi:hypothetical protein